MYLELVVSLYRRDDWYRLRLIRDVIYHEFRIFICIFANNLNGYDAIR